jgi:hypothetical protein
VAAVTGVFSLIAVVGVVGRQAIGDAGYRLAAAPGQGTNGPEPGGPSPAPGGKTDAGPGGQSPDGPTGKGWDRGADDGLGWDGNSGDSEPWHGGDWDGKGSDGKARDVEDVPCAANSLIAAITAANANGGGHLKLAHGCVYTLTADDGDGNGLPQIVQSITIKGEHSTIVREPTADPFRVFNVGNGGHLTLHKMTVAGGQTTGVVPSNGGGILVLPGGTAALNETTVTGNISAGGGGGLFNSGITVVHHSTISDNSALGSGGGVTNGGGGLLKVNESEVSWNSAADDGGGIADAGTSLINKTKILDNRALDNGGGIDTNGANTTVTHSLISGNSADDGGGLFATGSTVNLRHVTVSRNRAEAHGGGISLTGGTEAVIEKSAIVDNIANGNAAGINVVASTLTLRDSKVAGNLALGVGSTAGGVQSTGASVVSLVDVKVTDNVATTAPGGIRIEVPGDIEVDNGSTIIANRPTNCLGSPVEVPNCFG